MSRIWSTTCKFSPLARSSWPKHYCSPQSGDPEDLWDFGTVRHVNTVGRSQSNIQVSGPPLTWENDDKLSRASDSSSIRVATQRGVSGSTSSRASSTTAKGDLPPLPPQAQSRKFDTQSTVRHAPAAAAKSGHAPREPSDEYDDYGDQYVDDEIRVCIGLTL